jgi:hypothetical protein
VPVASFSFCCCGGGLATDLLITGYATLNRARSICVKECHSGSWCGWSVVGCSAEEDSESMLLLLVHHIWVRTLQETGENVIGELQR